jgi:SOS-response transcriptional repressor LexA
MTLPLTEAQEKLWLYIRSCERSPSSEEMAAAMGTSSKGRINELVTTLSAKGYVSYMRYRARSVVALDPSRSLLDFKTSELLAELEKRGILLRAAS